MAGRNGFESGVDFMHPYRLYRENINDGNGLMVDETNPEDQDFQDKLLEDLGGEENEEDRRIDMSKSISAQRRNTMNFIFKLLSGNANTFDIDLYMQLSTHSGAVKGNGLDTDDYYLVESAVGVTANKPVKFKELYAGRYTVLIKGLTGGNYDVFVSHFGMITHSHE